MQSRERNQHGRRMQEAWQHPIFGATGSRATGSQFTPNQFPPLRLKHPAPNMLPHLHRRRIARLQENSGSPQGLRRCGLVGKRKAQQIPATSITTELLGGRATWFPCPKCVQRLAPALSLNFVHFPTRKTGEAWATKNQKHGYKTE